MAKGAMDLWSVLKALLSETNTGASNLPSIPRFLGRVVFGVEYASCSDGFRWNATDT